MLTIDQDFQGFSLKKQEGKRIKKPASLRNNVSRNLSFFVQKIRKFVQKFKDICTNFRIYAPRKNKNSVIYFSACPYIR